jgi:hypothetical protein
VEFETMRARLGELKTRLNQPCLVTARTSGKRKSAARMEHRQAAQPPSVASPPRSRTELGVESMGGLT